MSEEITKPEHDAPVAEETNAPVAEEASATSEQKEEAKEDTEEAVQEETKTEASSEEKKDDAPKEEAKTSTPAGDRKPRQGGGDRRNFRKPRRDNRRREREKPEFDQKIISLRRVTRVMAGGRRFSFSVAMVIGDRKGRVGLGLGKANDTSLAIQKAVNSAKANLIKLSLTEDNSIEHEVDAKFNSARIAMRPNHGRGLVSGSSVRTVLEFAGVKDVTTRVLSRSRNKLNNARAAMKALEPFVVARGKAAQSAPKKQTEEQKVDANK